MRLNCKGPSPADSRDYPAPSLAAKQKYIDYRPWCRIAERQRANDCTFNGLEGLFQVPINKLRDIDYHDGPKLVDLNALGAYQDLCNLKYEGRDMGAYPRDVMKYAQKHGMIEISPEPDTVHTLKEYWKNRTVDDILNSLRTMGPQTISTEWMMSFANCKTNGGLIVLKPNDFRVGFHATCVEGYINKNGKDVFVVRNSHGQDFGVDGYFFIEPDTLSKILVESYGGLYNARLEDLARLAESLL